MSAFRILQCNVCVVSRRTKYENCVQRPQARCVECFSLLSILQFEDKQTNGKREEQQRTFFFCLSVVKITFTTHYIHDVSMASAKPHYVCAQNLCPQSAMSWCSTENIPKHLSHGQARATDAAMTNMNTHKQREKHKEFDGTKWMYGETNIKLWLLKCTRLGIVIRNTKNTSGSLSRVVVVVHCAMHFILICLLYSWLHDAFSCYRCCRQPGRALLLARWR